jgi:type II secretory pathway pseudopilin PulG
MSITNNNRAAYSIIETIVALSIIIILVSLSIPFFFNIKKYLLINEVDKLFVTFSYMQQKALASNKIQELFFDLENNSYHYTESNKIKNQNNLVNSIKFGFIKSVMGPPADPTELIQKITNFDNQGSLHRIRFFPNGKITAGTIYLVDAQEKLMVALTCPPAQVSYIRKYQYEDNKWKQLEP